MGGRRYYGVSKEKAAAREEYEGRKVNNENVGLVESRSVEGRPVVVCGGGQVSGGVWWRGGQWWCGAGRPVVVCGGEVSGEVG